MVDILSEETRALRPDLVELGHKEYEKQFARVIVLSNRIYGIWKGS